MPRKIDVLGALHLTLKHKKAKKKQGEFYTPPRVSDAMGAMPVDGLEPEEAIRDAWAGTGGVLRAAAAGLRKQGRDPHKYCWIACDIDPVVVAALAVNVHI